MYSLHILLVSFLLPAYLKAETFLPLSITPPDPPNFIYNKATTEFAVKLFSQIAKESDGSDNIFISPISVYFSMAMLNAGAKDESSKQIQEALGMKYQGKTLSQEQINLAVKALVISLSAEVNNVKVANKIWQQKYFCFMYCRKFAKMLQDYYFSELGEVNFAESPRRARESINSWISNKTNGKINNLIAAHALSTDTRFVLTNAILFQGRWKHPFIKEYTRPSRFTVLQKGKLKVKHVPLMYVSQNFHVQNGFGKDYALLDLPYKNEQFSMIIILPHKTSKLAKIEKSLSLKVLQSMADDLKRGPKSLIEVHLPKFKVSTGYKLNNALKALGIKDVFEPEADLSKITGFKGMHVSAVTHKAFIDVDELGTEASGGTGIITDDLTLNSIRINRPFLFFIHHKLSRCVVFLGRVMDPSK